MKRPQVRPSLPPFAVLACLLLLVACGESPTQAPTVDASVQLAKGGKDPVVNGAVPSDGAQGVTLDVRVLGSGFDNGSNARWLIQGGGTPDVTTNSTTYVSNSELVANITIDPAALEELYDIEVTSRRGKKGVGVELFSVKKPGHVEPSYEITETFIGGRTPDLTSAPDGLNLRVVGEFEESPAIWTPTTGWVPVPVRLDAPRYEVESVNDVGQMAGMHHVFGGDDQAVFWPSATEADIELGSAPSMEVFGINVHGDVVGSRFDHVSHPGEGHAMLWEVGSSGVVTTRDLHVEFLASAGFQYSVARDINNSGQVVGHGAQGGAYERAFLLDVASGEITILHPGPRCSLAIELNDAAPVQIAGFLDCVGGVPVRWTVSSDGTVSGEELSVPSDIEFASAWDISDGGDVVGSGRDGSGKDRLLLWTTTGSGPATVEVAEAQCARIDKHGGLVGVTRLIGCTPQPAQGRGKKKQGGMTLFELRPTG